MSTNIIVLAFMGKQSYNTQKFYIRNTTKLLKSFYLFLNTPVMIRGLHEIMNRYFLFLFDQFGVLHDGVEPVPGAINVLKTLESLSE